MKSPDLSRVAWLKAKDKSPLTPCLRFSCRVDDGDAAPRVCVITFDAKAIAQAAKFMRGFRVDVKGSVKLERWTAQDGTARTLVLSRRLPARGDRYQRAEARARACGVASYQAQRPR
jgi:hypothetical protein